MKKQPSLRRSLAKNLSFSALFAALCFVSTLLVSVPLPNGYFNTGDIFVLLAGWFLGPIFGAAAAAVGSALADVLGGFAIYAPATFLIKGSVAFVAWTMSAALEKIVKKSSLDFLRRIVSAVVAELVMVLGYFVFECALYGVAGGALALLGNTTQAVCCGVCAVLIIAALYPVPSIKKLFPALNK